MPTVSHMCLHTCYTHILLCPISTEVVITQNLTYNPKALKQDTKPINQNPSAQSDIRGDIHVTEAHKAHLTRIFDLTKFH